MSLPREKPIKEKFLWQTNCDGEVSSIVYTPDGKHISGGVGEKVVVWEKATGTVVWESTPSESATSSNVKIVACAPDGKTIASGDGRNVTLWSAQTGAKLWEKECAVNTVAYAPDGSTIAISDCTKLKLCSSEKGEELSEIELDREVQSVAYAPDGKTIVILANNTEQGGAKLTMWSVETSAILWEKESVPILYSSTNLNGSVKCMAYAPNGKTIVTGGTYMTLWNAKSGTKLWEDEVESDSPVHCVAYSPDEFCSWIAGGRDNKVKLWPRTGSGQPVEMECEAPGKVTSVAYSPDGSTIAIGDTGAPLPSSRHLTLTLVGGDIKNPSLPALLPSQLAGNPLEWLLGRCLPK